MHTEAGIMFIKIKLIYPFLVIIQFYHCNRDAFPLIKLIHIYGKKPSSFKEPFFYFSTFFSEGS